MVVTYKNKTLSFIHIGGNAGTSIEWYLYRLNLGDASPTVEHRSSGEFTYTDMIRDKGFVQWIGNQHESAQDMYDRGALGIAFTVIRNPYDRVLSKFFASPHSRRVTAGNVKRIFTDFVKEIYGRETGFAKKQWIHNRPQIEMIRYNGKEVESLLKFESLDADFRAFCDAHNLPDRSLIKCNVTQHSLKDMNIYTSEVRELVYANNKYIIDRNIYTCNGNN